MRPDILNPLFTEIEALKGVGPALAKPLERLGLARAVDVAFHLPVSFIDRRMVDELRARNLMAPPAGVEPTTYRLGGGRSIH